MFSRRQHLILCAGIFFVLVAAGLVAAQQSVNHLLHRDAVATGERWAHFLAQKLDDLEAIAGGAEPSEESRATLQQLRDFGLVYRYKIFAPDGRLVLSSEELAEGIDPATRLDEHNPTAARVVERGEISAVAKEGEAPRHPPFFAEAYAPVVIGGRTIAVVETYVDQTEKRREYSALFVYAVLSIGLFTALAFGVPAWAWLQRTQEKMRADEEIRFLGRHDLMTQLPNWKYFTETVVKSIAELPASGAALAVHYIDLDRLKDINNSMGREAGNEVMRQVADRLRAIAGQDALPASMGSDSFALLQRNVANGSHATALAERIRAEIEKPMRIDGRELSITASIGVAIAPAHATEFGRLMKCADIAHDRAKAAGRNAVRLFMRDMGEELDARIAIEEGIRAAIADESFELEFQPILRLATDRLTGFEALLRLPGPNGTLVSPDVFIPLAEQMGLIGEIGQWTMRRACRAAALWPEHLRLSVNLSPRQFVGANVARMVEEALAESGFDPHRLGIEVTESLLLSDAKPILAQLRRLKALGVGLIMDDFGTGYSSLRNLWRFPFDAIKIDGSFVRGLTGRDRSVEKIVTTIVALGRSLELCVTAEGVETERQAQFLRKINCDQVQGFLFGRPMPATDLAAAIFADHRRGLPKEPALPVAGASEQGKIARAAGA
jgi:diguanylate cyclase (GGDEF)-like protein